MVVTAAVTLRVIHIVPPGGGGVDRCVRDLVRHQPGSVIVHAGTAQCVVEQPAASRFTPLATEDLLRVAAEGALGAPLVLHAHGTVPVVRRLCDGLAAATAAPCVLTLHDIWFADAALAEAERAQRLDFVRRAAWRSAPSRFIVERAHQVLGEAVPVVHVPLASAPFDPAVAQATTLSAAADQACGDRGFSLAVIGAIGAHKGLAALEALAPRLPADLRIVVIGYTQRQLRQGWTADGRIWVHGIFHPDQLPRLVYLYGARLALFPPGMPESHCYALTDAWMSGLAVLAPDHGALAERVRRHGGGSLYDPVIGLDDWCARIVDEAAHARRHPGPVPLQPALPTMEAMMSQMQALYDPLPAGGTPRPPDDEALQRLAQKHLDGQFFRLEVTDLQREVEAAWRAAEDCRQRLAEQQALAAQRLSELDALQQRMAAQQAELVQAQQQRDASHAAYLGLRHRLLRPLLWLPAPLRRALAALARRLLR
jgi:hypothetical protein